MVFHAPSHHAMVQAAGYLKHTRATSHKKAVFFRGQSQLYNKLQPTLFRGVNDPRTAAKKRSHLSDLLSDIDRARLALKAVPTYSREPLLQHYGVHTTWLDVVDNIWVALWFACHTARGIHRDSEYIHFERRRPTPGSPDSYAYVLLLESAFFSSHTTSPGLYDDVSSQTIDLRVSAPSQFVRPHSQHGLLVRRMSNKGLPMCDHSPLLVGIIRVDLEAALEWLGAALTLSIHALFPPAFYDYGYRELLEHVTPARGLGCIHRIQP